jgi:hypothetical protein
MRLNFANAALYCGFNDGDVTTTHKNSRSISNAMSCGSSDSGGAQIGVLTRNASSSAGLSLDKEKNDWEVELGSLLNCELKWRWGVILVTANSNANASTYNGCSDRHAVSISMQQGNLVDVCSESGNLGNSHLCFNHTANSMVLR